MKSEDFILHDGFRVGDVDTSHVLLTNLSLGIVYLATDFSSLRGRPPTLHL
jgi:hypothetical protein